MVYDYLSIYLCRHDYYVFSSPSISRSSVMDTYIAYKLQNTLRVTKFIIHPFLSTDSPVGWGLDTNMAGAGKRNELSRRGTMCPTEHHSTRIRVQSCIVTCRGGANKKRFKGKGLTRKDR